MIEENDINKGFEFELFSILPENGKLTEHKLGKYKLYRKKLIKSMLVERYNSNSSDMFVEHIFNYSFDIPFDFKLTIGKKGKIKKVNTKIFYDVGDASLIRTQVGYTYLPLMQRFYLSLRFKKLWIQNSQNIMWIINILVAFLAVIATILTCNKKICP